MRTLDWSVSRSESNATEPVIDCCASDSRPVTRFGEWTTGSFIQLIVAGSQGLTDPHARPVSR